MNRKNGDGSRTCRDAADGGKPIETITQPVESPESSADLIGTLHHFQDVPSLFVKPRNVDIWLPPGYDEADADRHHVLYVQDGQNLFESQKAFTGVDWGLDQTMADLCEKKKIPPTIVVGVWNTPHRMREYLPQRPFCEHQCQPSRNRVTKRYGGPPISDPYLRFLVGELKPFVDRRYRTRPGRGSTFLMGSSMGGVLSLYALCEYPDIFGGAASLSTHWPIAHRSFGKYLKARLPEPGHHKLYLDYGSEADSAGYLSCQKRVEHLIREKGYVSGLDWLARWYPGDPHSETAWRNRVHVPLRFLLKTAPFSQR